MRPTSQYLEVIKAEKVKVKFHLAGSTPPAPANWAIRIKVSAEESPHSKEFQQVTTKLAAMYGVSKAQIALTNGSSQAMFQVLAAISKPGDKILMENPLYEPFEATAKFLGLKIVRFKRGEDFAADYSRIKRIARGGVKAIVISNPHCPTGWIYSEAQLKKIAALGPRLVVDEVFLPLATGGGVVQARHRNIIAISGLSKSLGLSNLRVGWVCADRKTTVNVNRVALNLNIDMPLASVLLANEALKHWHKILAPLVKRSQVNGKALCEFAAKYPGSVIGDPGRGHLRMLKVPSGFHSGTAFALRVLKDSIWMRAGEHFGHARTVRIHLLLDPKDFSKVLRALGRYYG